jgi:hypothetical protein
MGMFLFGAACGAIMFAVAADRTIFCSLAYHRYGPLLTPSFLDVYGWIRHKILAINNS